MQTDLIHHLCRRLEIPHLKYQRIQGGDAAQAWRIDVENGRKFFLKTASSPGSFAVEAEGLNLFSSVDGLRVPQVVDVGRNHLLLEWIDFGPPARNFQEALGQLLAKTHRELRSDFYGFTQDHTLGRTPQKNLPQVPAHPGSWAEFWWTHRLEPMVKRLNCPEISRLAVSLARRLPERITDPYGKPSLLHGDLWSGNTAADGKGMPVLFDPAPSYGHPEADLAMTRLFGGFDAAFYRSYLEQNPLEDAWESRQDLYMLYHVLNHAVLFGGGYLQQAERILHQNL
ncbi:MAG: fructosamine kinase family protein [Kiritimatiellia bacterium]